MGSNPTGSSNLPVFGEVRHIDPLTYKKRHDLVALASYNRVCEVCKNRSLQIRDIALESKLNIINADVAQW